MTTKKKSLKVNNQRGKQYSIVIEPTKVDYDWRNEVNDGDTNKLLIDKGFPLWTEVNEALVNLEGETLKGQTEKPQSIAFGTESSTTNGIPHYQCYVAFQHIVKRKSIKDQIVERFKGRAFVLTEVVYGNAYEDYCIKETSNFEFNSNYYWNIKVKEGNIPMAGKLIHQLREKLDSIYENLFMGQRLLVRIANSPAFERYIYWLADVLGGTGKTTTMQSVIDRVEKSLDGLYCKVTPGDERLIAKIDKKINYWLKTRKGYPRYMWINFGRTTSEETLTQFSSVGEDIVDGMLDHNFGNTGGKDFTRLPYINLVVTANTVPNVKQLTGDRIKLMTLFPVYAEEKGHKLKEAYLVPVYVEIKVRFTRKYPNVVDYKYVVKVQDFNYIQDNFGEFEWYNELRKNVHKYLAFTTTEEYQSRKYDYRMESDWRPITVPKMTEAIREVYHKAMHFNAGLQGKPDGRFVIASSHNSVEPRLSYYTGSDSSAKILIIRDPESTDTFKSTFKDILEE